MLLVVAAVAHAEDLSEKKKNGADKRDDPSSSEESKGEGSININIDREVHVLKIIIFTSNPLEKGKVRKQTKNYTKTKEKR